MLGTSEYTYTLVFHCVTLQAFYVHFTCTCIATIMYLRTDVFPFRTIDILPRAPCQYRIWACRRNTAFFVNCKTRKRLYSKNLIQIAVYQFTIGKFLKIDIVMVNLPKKLSALSHTSCNFTWTKHVHIVRVMLCTPFERNVCKLCANKACPS